MKNLFEDISIHQMLYFPKHPVLSAAESFVATTAQNQTDLCPFEFVVVVGVVVWEGCAFCTR